MSDQQSHVPAPEDFVSISEILRMLPNTFPSENSLRWFIRRHRKALSETWGIGVFGRQLKFHRELFPRHVVELSVRGGIAGRG
jgi:hypothetical protein